MIPTEPEVSDTGRYTVTETAKLLGLSRPTIYSHITTDHEKKSFNPITHKPTSKKLISGKEIKKFWRSTY